jgi:hyperosmotically inducible periplasmic protein
MPTRNPRHNRIEVPLSGRRSTGRGQPAASAGRRSAEAIVAATVIGAAALATFLALFLTSRPYDPMTSTIAPRPDIPPSSIASQSSPKPSSQPSVKPSPTPVEAGGSSTGLAIPDDAAIQAEIERKVAADPTISNLDVSTIVEGGKVTLVGSVKSQELKTRVDKLIRSVKGVTSVDNQLVLTESTPPPNGTLSLTS